MPACPVCGSPVAADARFCASCGTALVLRCDSCGTALPADARFCPSCGKATSPGAEAAAAKAAGEERKVVSVVFADLVGFTAAGDGADPEDISRRLSPFHQAIRQEVERHGGRIEKLMGDGVLAVFGAPLAHEDDAERAVRAGLRIQERVAEMAGGILSARVAVGTGEAVVVIEGTTMDHEGLVGDVVNTTSRLQHEAPPGSVLVDEPTYRLTRRVFQYEERRPVVVRGKSEPLTVWMAVAPIGRFGADVDDDGVALFGREIELSLLIDAFSRSRSDRRSQIVTISGEPGVGKSRLVRELRRHIDDLPDLARWRRGRCLPYGESIVYWAFGEIVKAEAGILETDLPRTAAAKLRASLEPLMDEGDERTWVAGRLAPLVGIEEEAIADREELFAAWSRYVAALAEQRPTVLVFEDLHWADPALLALVSGIPEAAQGTPLLVVGTARSEFFEDQPTWGSGQRNAITIHLEPLDPAATSRLLDALLADVEVSEDRRAAIATRSGGNPLWAQEFARMLRDRPDVATNSVLPENVQAVVAARIDLLDAEPKAVIQAAATLGNSFWPGAVTAMLPDQDDDVDAICRELARRELIRRARVSTMAGESEYAFSHGVIRDVAYGRVPRRVRADRHHRVARWIEAQAGERLGDRAQVIAHHDAEALRLAIATDTPDVTRFVDAAIPSHLRAAVQTAHLDLDVHRSHLEAALELMLAGDPRRAPALLDLANAVGASGLVDTARKLSLEARGEFEMHGDTEGWARASVYLGRNAWLAGDPDAAATFGAAAITALEALPPGSTLAEAYAFAASRLWLLGENPTEVLALVNRVRSTVDTHGSARTRTRLLQAEGGSRFDLGDPAAIGTFRSALAMAIESDNSEAISTAHLNLGEQLRTGWGLREAILVHERGMEVARRRRVRGSEQFLALALAYDYFLAFEWNDAAACLDVFRAMPEKLPYLRQNLEIEAMALEACRGLLVPLERVDSAIDAALGIRDLQVVIPTLDSACWALELGDSRDRAAAAARQIVERSGPSRFLIDAFPMTLRVLRAVGELGQIEPLLPELRRFTMPRPEALVAFAAALLGEEADPESACRVIEDAAVRLADLDATLEATVLLAEAMRVSRDTGDEAGIGRIRERVAALALPPEGEFLLARLGLD
ncbi:MAG: AAA family ATPase [Acidimicrobiia bacterium]|nr:AAA family ATPase [Acidimicrobiia bacterium]